VSADEGNWFTSVKVRRRKLNKQHLISQKKGGILRGASTMQSFHKGDTVRGE